MNEISTEAFSHLIDYIHAGVVSGNLPEEAVNAFRHCLGDALSKETLQGWSFHKPYGYSGDFQILDNIYQEHRNREPVFREWDIIFQQCEAVLAVRNRKQFFKDLLKSLEDAVKSEPIRVLNVASGPGRDVAEYFCEAERTSIVIDCVDQDQNAIEHARALCKMYLDRVEFIERNAFRFQTDNRYHLIWSAGLFDYLSDKQFIYLTKRLLDLLEPDGELVIGNFSTANPSRAYMEIVGDWHLHHRDEHHLARLARECGVKPGAVQVTVEPQGINLFLHMRKNHAFIPLKRCIVQKVSLTHS